MTIRVTTYLDNVNARKKQKYENKSRLFKNALNMYLINKDYFLTKEKPVENHAKDYKFKLEKEKYKFDLNRNQLEKIDRRKK